jgi:F0F1-type ATP synthase membrane subunit b/b'
MGTLDSILSVFTLTRYDLIMIFVSMGLFYVLWKNLDRLFVSKYIIYLQHRERLTQGNLEQAVVLEKDAMRLAGELDAERREARARSMEKRIVEIADAKRELDRAFKLSELKINTELDANKKKYEDLAQQTEASLAKSLPELINQIKDSLNKGASASKDRSGVSLQILVLCLSVVLLSGAAPALAQAGGQEHQATFSSILFPTINFVIFSVALFLLMKKPVAEIWKKRRRSIAQRLADVTASYDKAKNALEQVEREKARLQEQLGEIEEDFAKQTISEISELKKNTQNRIAQIESDMSIRMERQRKAISDDLFERVVNELMVKVQSEVERDFSRPKEGEVADRRFSETKLREIQQNKDTIVTDGN